MLTIYEGLLAATSPEEILYGYGPLGIGVAALSIFAYKLFNIILKDRDKAIADRDALNEDIINKVIPAVIHSTQVLENHKVLDEQILDTLKEVNFNLVQTRLSSNKGA